MARSAYRHSATSFRRLLKPEGASERRATLMTWRRTPAVTRLEHPWRRERARALGWKSKPGFIVARVRLRRGGQRKRAIIAGRRPKRKGILRLTLAKSLQRIAEERAQKHFPNLEVLNSYWVGEDGHSRFFEVLLIDPDHPVVRSDPKVSWITEPAHKGRVYRGRTSAGQRGRGLRWKGAGAERMRPSRKANQKYFRRTQTKVIP